MVILGQYTITLYQNQMNAFDELALHKYKAISQNFICVTYELGCVSENRYKLNLYDWNTSIDDQHTSMTDAPL